VGLRTVEDARIQNPADPRWIITAPWEEDYLLWSLHHLVELGWPDAGRPRDFLLRLRVGMLTHAEDFDPRLATPYRLVVGEWRPDRTPAVYDDWKTLGRENARLSKPDVPNYGCSYAYSARAALICGLDAGFPEAREALATLEALLPGHREIMAREPYWAIAPGGAAAASGKPSSAASPKAASAEWLRWGITSDAPLWGLRGGLVFGIHPGGRRNDGGPRGLIRIRYPVLPKGEYDLINFIAVEPWSEAARGSASLSPASSMAPAASASGPRRPPAKPAPRSRRIPARWPPSGTASSSLA